MHQYFLHYSLCVIIDHLISGDPMSPFQRLKQMHCDEFDNLHGWMNALNLNLNYKLEWILDSIEACYYYNDYYCSVDLLDW